MPLTLGENITAYEGMQHILEADKFGKWVVFFDGKLRGEFSEFHEAVEFAVAKWGRGPYLVRQVGRPPFTVPASVQYRRTYADC